MRNSAKCGLQERFQKHDLLEQPEAVETVMKERKGMTREYSGKRRDHFLEVKEDPPFYLQPQFAQLTRGSVEG
ncbi:hypothetical protein JCM17823_23680 [Halorubrum gandharaense]